MSSGPRRGSLFIIFLTVFIDLLGFGMVLPLLPIYGKQFAADHGLTAAQVGWVTGLLLSSFSAMQLLFMPIWGRLSDRVGRRPILLLGLFGSTVCYALFGVATMWRSLAGLFAARLGAGIAGATIATAQAYIADSTSKENRAKGMALIGAAFALGFTLGPLLGSAALLAGDRVEFSPWPGYAASAFSACALLLALFRLPESWQPGMESSHRRVFDIEALRRALATPSVGLLLLTSFIAVFSFANFESTLSLQIKHLSDSFATGELTSGLISGIVAFIRRRGYEHQADIDLVLVLCGFAYLGLILTLAQGVLVRRLAGRVSDGALLITGGITAIAGFLWLAYATSTENLGGLLIAMAIEVTGFALVNPALQSLISRRTHPDFQGGVLGIGQSCTSLARILGPIFGLRLFVQGAALPYWSAAGILILALAMMVGAVRSGRDWSENG